MFPPTMSIIYLVRFLANPHLAAKNGGFSIELVHPDSPKYAHASHLKLLQSS